MYQQPTNVLQFYGVFLFIIYSPTCFDQQTGYHQGDVFDTRIQLQLHVWK